jgi:hypothetical protein
MMQTKEIRQKDRNNKRQDRGEGAAGCSARTSYPAMPHVEKTNNASRESCMQRVGLCCYRGAVERQQDQTPMQLDVTKIIHRPFHGRTNGDEGETSVYTCWRK